MSYGATQSEIYTIAAEQVAKILDGARPSELPLRQATRFELVINNRTAKALGLTIPPSLLAASRRGDRMDASRDRSEDFRAPGRTVGAEHGIGPGDGARAELVDTERAAS